MLSIIPGYPPLAHSNHQTKDTSASPKLSYSHHIDLKIYPKHIHTTLLRTGFQSCYYWRASIPSCISDKLYENNNNTGLRERSHMHFSGKRARGKEQNTLRARVPPVALTCVCVCC